MGTKRVQMKGVLPGFVNLLVVPVIEILFSLGCSRAQYKIFFSSLYTISISLFPSPSKLGRQTFWVA
jgi:hypothetical protein